MKLSLPLPQSRSRGAIPRWLLFTGLGCGVLILLAAVGSYLAYRYVKTEVIEPGMNPELNWPKLQKLLPFEQRPSNLELDFGLDTFGMEMYTLRHSSGLQVIVMHLPEADGQKTKDAITDPSSYQGFMGMGKRKDTEGFQLTIQGVERKGLRFTQEGVNTGEGMISAASVILDFTPEGSLRPVLVQLTRTSTSSDAISEAEIQQFFEPFHVGQR